MAGRGGPRRASHPTRRRTSPASSRCRADRRGHRVGRAASTTLRAWPRHRRAPNTGPTRSPPHQRGMSVTPSAADLADLADHLEGLPARLPHLGQNRSRPGPHAAPPAGWASQAAPCATPSSGWLRSTTTGPWRLATFEPGRPTRRSAPGSSAQGDRSERRESVPDAEASAPSGPGGVSRLRLPLLGGPATPGPGRGAG